MEAPLFLTAAAASAVVDNVINMGGVIRARAAGTRSGVIVLEAGDAGGVQVAGLLDVTGAAGASGGKVSVTGKSVDLTAGARVDASGDTGGGTILIGGGWQGKGGGFNADTTTIAAGAHLKADALAAGDGGTVVVWANDSTRFGGTISARGGETGGNGGKVEVSGKQSLGFSGNVDTRAPHGQTGTLLLDPLHAVISSAADGTAGDTQTINAATLVANLDTSNVTVSADESITVNAMVDSSAQGNSHTLHFDDANGGGLVVNLNAAITLGANQRLTGEATMANVASGGRIQNGVDVAMAGATINVGAGSYAEQVMLGKSGLILTGEAGAQLAVASGQTGFTVAANNVTIEGMEIIGPYSQPYTAVNWNGEPGITSAVTIQPGILGATIRGNNIRDVRTGVLFLNNATGSVTGNTIDNTKGSILIRSDGVAVTGNTTGAVGSEWDIVFLNNVTDGAYFVSPHVSQAQYGAGVMAMSAGNGGMHVLDRRYGSNGLLGSTPQFGNRSHISVNAGSNFTAVDDFNLGNGLGNERQPLGFISDGINAVVAGGFVSVGAGTYAENIVIGKALTLAGSGKGVTIIDPVGNVDGVLVSGNIGASATVAITDLTIQGGRNGVKVADATTLGTITLDGVVVRDNASNGFISSNGGANPTSVTNINILNSLFEGNGFGNGSADINLFRFNGNAQIRNVDVLGTRGLDVSASTDYGLQIRGHGELADMSATGSVVLENVHISGNYKKAHLAIQRYGDAENVVMQDVVLGGAYSSNAGDGMVSAGSSAAGWGAFFSSDMRGGLSLGNTEFSGGNFGFGDIRIGEGTGGFNVEAAQTRFGGITRTHAAAGAENFVIEDRVTHALDNPAVGGLVTWQDGNLYVTQASGSIQRGLDAAVVGDSVNVASGAYAENILLTKNLTLLGADASVSSLGSVAGTAVGLSGDWVIGGQVNFAGILTLVGAVSLDTSAVNAAIAFQGAVAGQGAGGQDLTLNAGSGTVTVHNMGTASAPLGDIVVRAGNYAGAAGTAYVATLDIDAGDVAVGHSTVNATGGVTINSANLSGSINAADVVVNATGNVDSNIAATNTASVSGGNVQGSVHAIDVQVTAAETANATVVAVNTAVVSGANVLGVVQGADVQVTATETANTTVVATNSATVSGANVQGYVQAPTATVVATQTVDINADIGNLNLTAQSGGVTGNVGSVHLGAGGGVIAVNGESTVNMDSSVARSQVILDPAAQSLVDYTIQPIRSPASYAFSETARSVFSQDFALGAASQNGVDADSGLSEFFGNIWNQISERTRLRQAE